MADPQVSFIVPVRNDHERLRLCLEAIRENETASGVPCELIVAEGGSRDRSREVANELGTQVLDLPGLKVSAMRNRAAARAKGEVLCFCDADNIIAPGWLAAALDTLHNTEAEACGAPYHAPNPGTWVAESYDGLRKHEVGRAPTRWLGSGNLAVLHAAFLSLNGFDETLETCEDVDFCKRLRKTGRALLYDSRMKSIHLGDPNTLRQVFRSELWRGRDNLRVSLRSPIKLEDIPGVAIPIVDLLLLAVGAITLATGAQNGILIASLCVVAIGGLSALRATKMISHSKRLGYGQLPQAFAVACAYDLARAMALVWPAGHHRK